MDRRLGLTACLLAGTGWFVACSSKPELGPVVIAPVDKDINGEVIVRAEVGPEGDAKPGDRAERFGAGKSAEGRGGGSGALFAADDSVALDADSPATLEGLEFRAGASGGSRGGSGGGSGGGLFGDDSPDEASRGTIVHGVPGRTDRHELKRIREVEPGSPGPATVDPIAGETVTRVRARDVALRAVTGTSETESLEFELIAGDGALVDGHAEEADGDFDESLSAGTLTAGALNDWPDASAYRDFIARLAGDDDNVYQKFTGQTFELQFLSESGAPLANADITVEDQLGDRSIQIRSRTDGRAVVSTTWDLLESDEDLLVTVNPLRGASYTVTVDPDNPVTHTVRVPRTPDSRDVEMVQIALVMDCTGSMGDELEYLKVELKSIAEAVDAAYPDVDQRFALVAYRDAEDAYVTRTIDFTHGLPEFIAALGQQSANGGGDEPEAVQRAYAEAATLSWADGRVARVMVHVADAPPHEKNQSITLRSVDTLRAKGVAVYPLASSSSSDYAQFTMRTSALLTGAQYLFLTDDSGVGNAHAEPTESKGYAVMPLRSHLLRVIASEIAGEEMDVDEAMVIRRVESAD